MGRPKGSKNKIHATHCLNGHPRTPENVSKSGGCIECHKEIARDWYERNSELTKERASSWEKENPKSRKVIITKSRRKHAAERNAYRRKRIEDNPNIRSKKNKATALWKKENPERCRALENKRRTAKTAAGGFFTSEEWFTLCFAVGFLCLCCKKKRPLEADHVIPVSKGGPSWLWNIQPLCKPCNVSKGNKTIDYRK